jgi:hypothetical protein
MFVFLASHRNGFINSCLSFEDLLAYRIWWIHVEWCNFPIHLRDLKIPPSPYSEAPSMKIMIQIKLVGMSIIFHCTKLRLSKWNGSWVVSIKQNVNFKFQLHTVFTFLVFCKMCLIKIWKSVSKQNFMVPCSQEQVLQPPQKFENPTIAIFKSSIIENNNSNKTCRYVLDLSLYKPSFVYWLLLRGGIVQSTPCKCDHSLITVLFIWALFISDSSTRGFCCGCSRHLRAKRGQNLVKNGCWILDVSISIRDL